MRRLALLTVLLLAAVACGGAGEDGAVAPQHRTAERVDDGDPSAAGGEELCADSTSDFADVEPSPFDTADAALRDLETDGDIGLLAALSLDGTSILLDGQVVGRVAVVAVPAGGFAVEGYSYCYPAERDLTVP